MSFRKTVHDAPSAAGRREDGVMTTTKSAIEAGQTLVARYKGDNYSCEVVEHKGRLHYVLPGRGRANPKVFTSPICGGPRDHRLAGQRLPLLVGAGEGLERTAGAPDGGSGGGHRCGQVRARASCEAVDRCQRCVGAAEVGAADRALEEPARRL